MSETPVQLRQNPLSTAESTPDLVVAAASAAKTRRPTTIVYTRPGGNRVDTRLTSAAGGGPEAYPWDFRQPAPVRRLERAATVDVHRGQDEDDDDDEEDYIHPSLENRKWKKLLVNVSCGVVDKKCIGY